MLAASLALASTCTCTLLALRLATEAPSSAGVSLQHQFNQRAASVTSIGQQRAAFRVAAAISIIELLARICFVCVAVSLSSSDLCRPGSEARRLGGSSSREEEMVKSVGDPVLPKKRLTGPNDAASGKSGGIAKSCTFPCGSQFGVTRPPLIPSQPIEWSYDGSGAACYHCEQTYRNKYRHRYTRDQVSNMLMNSKDSGEREESKLSRKETWPAGVLGLFLFLFILEALVTSSPSSVLPPWDRGDFQRSVSDARGVFPPPQS